MHLGSIGDLVGLMLAKRMNLGGNADSTYRSQVDPRLNYEQALELAMLIARRVS